ncbi:DUF3040 domain-containing protein [Lentzea sp. NEAU-D13]|uniref:DUF3040 domain-containing protein n=1 Tax=Lentzea alba TaxID=2714351 RepID=A0A7C9VUT5_9PSEU|nr:DUF3040 domain-containing protein [Lentzea alba]NGY65114.1 DUF3040 domain-containing protein [Lentzea alba]
MLSESERETLHEIQRKLSGDDPDFARYFHGVGPPAPVVHRQSARASFVVVTEMVIALAVVGPNILTDTQISALTVPPAPRRRTK